MEKIDKKLLKKSDLKTKKIIGVIGGMGPLASCDFYRTLIELVPAEKDQEHARVIIMSDPTIPDRTKAILEDGEDPLPYMIDIANRLIKAGAHFIVIPCNTAHFFVKEIKKAIDVPIISIIDATLKRVKDKGFSSALLFATDATVSTGLYEENAKKWGIKVYTPDKENQKLIMKAIRLVKKGTIPEAKKITRKVVKTMLDTFSVECIIGGCTEVPLMWDTSFGIEFISSSEALARVALLYAFGEKIDERLFVKA